MKNTYVLIMCVIIAISSNALAQSDPLEAVNRPIFTFNKIVDKLIFEPIDKTYEIIIPQIFRHGVSNFFDNLKNPMHSVNALLQGEFKDAGNFIGIFVVNTMAGVGGLIDAASPAGLSAATHPTFSSTLEAYGMGDGFYIVLPIVGPTTPRHLVGNAVDNMPLVLVIQEQRSVKALNFINTKHEALQLQKQLEETAMDEYAAVRSVFLQAQEKHSQTTTQLPLDE